MQYSIFSCSAPHTRSSPRHSFIKYMRSPAPLTQLSVISHSPWAPTNCCCVCFGFFPFFLLFLHWKRKCGNCVVYILNQLGHWAEFRCASVLAAWVWKLQRAHVLPRLHVRKRVHRGRRSLRNGSCITVLNMRRKRRKFNSSFVALLGVTRSQMKQNQLWLIEMNDCYWRRGEGTVINGKIIVFSLQVLLVSFRRKYTTQVRKRVCEWF